MAYFFEELSRTFSEYLLVPGYSSSECIPSNVSLRTPLVKFRKGEESAISLNIPMVSAIMQSVSGERMGEALAREGGVAFIYGSQSAESEAEMIRRVKAYKAGFVESDSNLTPDSTLGDVLELTKRTGHSTIAITSDGTATGKLEGVVTSRDYRISRMTEDEKVSSFMTPVSKIIYGKEGITLSEANDIIWEHKLNQLPILTEDGHLVSFVFRKDYSTHKENPNELLDSRKRYIVGAGINTRDYETRVPLLVDAGADVLCIDSSEGFSEWQQRTLSWIRERYGDSVKVGAGNVVDGDGITRETKGIGRGQASALIDVVKARDEYYEKTGVYIPVCSDGGIVFDYHMTIALAMGADYVMLGRYFARFDESPSALVNINGNYLKEYWGEGSQRARNWQRYDLGGERKLSFPEGVDSYVPYAGSLKDNVALTISKIKSTMCNCGALSLEEFRKKARLTIVSPTSIVEGGAHDVILKDKLQMDVK